MIEESGGDGGDEFFEKTEEEMVTALD